MPIKINSEKVNGPVIKAGYLVRVGADVILITGEGYTPNFRGVVLNPGEGVGNKRTEERVFRICDVETFNGTVTITNKQD